MRRPTAAIRQQSNIGLHLILLTMVRKSELLLARREQVDFEQAEWHIRAEHSKTGKPHIVFLRARPSRRSGNNTRWPAAASW
jgi:integrase